MSEEEKMQIIGKIETKPIRFDVFLVEDTSRDGDWGSPHLENVGHIEALVFLSECSYFNFKITEHGNPNNVFIRGSCEKIMLGGNSISLGWADEDKADDIKKMIRCKFLTLK